MARKLTLGGITGGVIYFIWSFFSWVVLPWHLATMEKFSDEDLVAGALRANAPKKGIYILPNVHKGNEGTEKEYDRVAQEAAKNRMRTGPFAFAAITPNGVEPEMGSTMLLSFAVQILGAILLTFLLLHTNGLSYRKKVLFVAITAVAASVLCQWPYWVWWGFGTAYTFVSFLDLVIGWTLAGLAIAKIV
ncbi:MAG: hypothetical protein H6617_06965 [Bdellovibrionaceae bacterium]|nr:hypothetical protein [Bdellovibrionales bacterium]MCB9254407.1 hypothetical protein [Pseudobdellovibrionaceae bacterium]